MKTPPAAAPFFLVLPILALLTGCATDPAKSAPAAGVATVAATAAVTAAPMAGETLAIDPSVSKLNWTGSKVTKSHAGGFKTFQGTITLVEGKPESSRVSVEIDIASLWTDPEKLVTHLKSNEFFDLATFPKATFTSTAITAGGTDGASHTVKGNLTLHGITKEITFPATITVGEKEVTAKSRFSLKRKDFGIVYPGPPNDLIRDDVLVEWDLVAKRTSA